MQQVVDSYCIFSFVDQNRLFGLISAPKQTGRTVPLVTFGLFTLFSVKYLQIPSGVTKFAMKLAIS